MTSEQRDAGLDLVRFIYIAMMVVYHCFQVSQSLADEEMVNINRYLGLVSGSFPFLAGFLISHHYLKKLRAGDYSLGIKLIGRGARLLAIYAVINAAILFWLQHISDNWPFPKSENPWLSIIYVNPTYVAYDILAPLGLIMVIGGACATLYARTGQASAASLQTLFGIGGTTLAILTEHPYLASGLAGMTLGVATIDAVITRAFTNRILLIGAALYGPVFAIAFASPRNHETLYVLGVITLFYLIRGCAAFMKLRSSELHYEIRLYGSYSLLIYIAHVPVLVFLSYNMQYLMTALPGTVIFAAFLVIIYILLSVFLRLVERVRTRFCVVNRMYRMILG